MDHSDKSFIYITQVKNNYAAIKVKNSVSVELQLISITGNRALPSVL